MRAGKIDKRDHEIAKKTQFCQFVNNTSYGFSTCNFILCWKLMFLKLTKDNSNFAKINETIPVKKVTIAWSVETKFNMKFKWKTQKL